MNRVDARLDRLEFAACLHARDPAAWRCQGLDLGEILELVTAAVALEDQDLFQTLLNQIEEYKHRPPREIANGKLVQDVHGFVHWVLMLKHGSSSLPDQLPRPWLEAWIDGYIHHPAAPLPHFRCEGCKLALPNSSPDGGFYFDSCPHCGNGNLSYRDISGNEKDGWPAAWEYRPIARTTASNPRP
jgi:hypothetical protein